MDDEKKSIYTSSIYNTRSIENVQIDKVGRSRRPSRKSSSDARKNLTSQLVSFSGSTINDSSLRGLQITPSLFIQRPLVVGQAQQEAFDCFWISNVRRLDMIYGSWQSFLALVSHEQFFAVWFPFRAPESTHILPPIQNGVSHGLPYHPLQRNFPHNHRR